MSRTLLGVFLSLTRSRWQHDRWHKPVCQRQVDGQKGCGRLPDGSYRLLFSCKNALCRSPSQRYEAERQSNCALRGEGENAGRDEMSSGDPLRLESTNLRELLLPRLVVIISIQQMGAFLCLTPTSMVFRRHRRQCDTLQGTLQGSKAGACAIRGRFATPASSLAGRSLTGYNRCAPAS